MELKNNLILCVVLRIPFSRAERDLFCIRLSL